MRRWWAVLAASLALVFLAPTVVVADDPPSGGLVADVTEVACDVTGAGIVSDLLDEPDTCERVGVATEKGVKKAWASVWESIVGDIIRVGVDAVKWLIKKTMTFALQGPTINLEETGLFGPDATLAGMLVWLGWVIAAFGVMWQLGRMAVSGQSKYAGRALLGWFENMAVTAVGVSLMALLIVGVDKATTGLVDLTFDNANNAHVDIATTMVFGATAASLAGFNPMLIGGAVVVILILGFITMAILFLRDIAIPIQALLLPIAGGGRTGGETTQKWLPKLCTASLSVIFSKFLIAVILCAGFAGMDGATSLVAWFRGAVTYGLACAAPFMLMKFFQPLGMAVGSGLAMGGALGAAANIATLMEKSRGGGGGGARGGAPDAAEQDHGGETKGGAADAVSQAQRLERTMPSQGGSSSDKKAVPTQRSSDADAGTDASASGGSGSPKAGGASAVAGAGAGAAAGAGIALEVLDGVATQAAGPAEPGGGGADGAPGAAGAEGAPVATARVGAAPASSGEAGPGGGRIDVLDGTSDGVRGGDGT
ncbi:hypothetical protein C0Q58_14390 [Streptomyces albidoflavus]|uniref:hypothetical protein n=1 Tax=Streptomyces albidoflavus TaxID=1886 RepID=UPI00101E6F1E|nr:hypothetical protein [Streptomyces albidoflavus]RZD62925.1 hypothetical protein C0Q58_14390 [Streptomyces albidoflavus]